jgi:transposase
MAKHAGCRRFVWNYFLKQNIETYQQTQKFVFYNEMASRLPALKQEYPWLREVYSLKKHLGDHEIQADDIRAAISRSQGPVD